MINRPSVFLLHFWILLHWVWSELVQTDQNHLEGTRSVLPGTSSLQTDFVNFPFSEQVHISELYDLPSVTCNLNLRQNSMLNFAPLISSSSPSTSLQIRKRNHPGLDPRLASGLFPLFLSPHMIPCDLSVFVHWPASPRIALAQCWPDNLRRHLGHGVTNDVH
jgi:hypothetical protein